MAEIERDSDAAITVLQARARHSGRKPDDYHDMRAPAHGEDAGRAIYALRDGDEAKRLWDAYRSLSSAYRRYLAICLGLSPDAKTARIEMMKDRFETDASDTPDMRTAEERYRAAWETWHEWKAAIDGLPQEQSRAIHMAIPGGPPALMDAGKVTPGGRRFVEALAALDTTGGTF